jgi:glycosyltransferase involved in cell wall biosynthesis
MKVAYINRDRRDGNFSIEELFFSIQQNLNSKIEIENYTLPSFRKQLNGIVQVSKIQSDVYHLTGDANYLALGLPKNKTVLTIHDVGSLDNNTGFRKFILKTWYFSIPVHRVKLITVISEFTKNKVIDYFNIDPKIIRVIHNCVFPGFTYCPIEITGSIFKILIVGTAKNKNIEGIIDASEGLPVELTFIGKLSQEQITQLNRKKIHYRNYFNLSRVELVDQYKKCDCLYFASWYEGFGIPIIEANAVGRPVITSNRCSMPEVASNAAAIVNPSSIEEIRTSLVHIMEDNVYRESLIKNGLENAKRFSVDTISKKYLQVYSEISEQ